MNLKLQQVAILGGGCFWCLEAAFELLRGVISVESGYAGGTFPDPTYQAVCAGNTGHAEVVRITYDPKIIQFNELLDVFFTIHDPTTLHRQGADIGTQYRSIIICQDDDQKEVAAAKISSLNSLGIWKYPIVTELTCHQPFWIAEPYHQGYFRSNPTQGYCQAVVAGKVGKMRSHFAEKLKQ